MNPEKLIENVKAHEPLYVTTHPKYGDQAFKKNIWKGIAKEMNQPVVVCKKAWTNLRDSFRRSLKKRRKEIKTGQSVSRTKKWKFEDQMSFVVPFLQEREVCGVSKDISDDDDDDNNEDDTKENERDDRGDDRSNRRGDNRIDEEGDDENRDDVDGDVKKEKKVHRKKTKRRRYEAPPESTSGVSMKYSLDVKTRLDLQSNAIDTFFASIASTVKNFSPYYQNIAKSQIFSIISDLEMQQIMQEQSFCVTNSSRQQNHFPKTQPCHLGPYDVSQILSSASPSPPSSKAHSMSPSPSRMPSPSNHDFPATIPAPRFKEETADNENV